MDFPTQQLVEQVVLLKATHGEMFTAHDVTRAVRAQVGRQVNVPHADVKTAVHGMYVNGLLGSDYTRTLADFPGVSPLPWIYHRRADDPAAYRRPDDSVPPSPFPVTGGPSISLGQQPGIDLAQETCCVDGRETLCIPAKYVRGLGLQPGDTIFVSGDMPNNCVLLGKDHPQGEFAEYVVDKYGNVRITQSALQRCGQGGKEYTVEHAGGAVKIARKG